MSGPLQGITLLDLSTGVAGPYATKLLADHGATVIKVEPPGGDPSRLDGPFPGNTPNPEASGRFLFLNTSKRSIVLDLDSAADRDVLRALAGACDAVVEDLAPGRLDELGLGYEALNDLRPGVILASITPWGQDGPYAGYRQTDITAQAMGGPMLWTGSADKEPLRMGGGGAVAQYHAGAIAAVAITAALYRQEQTGEGDHIDLSIYETQVGSRDRSAPYLVNYIYNGTEPKRQLHGIALANGMRPCADGYIHINGSSARLTAFLSMIGRPDLAALPDLNTQTRNPGFVEEVETAYMIWLAEHSKAEVVRIAQGERLLAGAINSVAEMVEDEHLRVRGVWETIEHPHTGPLTYPGRPFILPASPRPQARRAPLLDEHGEAIRAEAAAATPRAAVSLPGRTSGRLPLEGVRVADITLVWAGPHCTQILADWGAEVIRVEPVTRIQPQTRWAERRTSRAEEIERGRHGIAARGSYPDYEPGADPWNRNSGFNSHARNKRSVACDIMTAEGRQHFLDLIATCDVLVENNIPETIARAGITYNDLKQVRPDLIMLRMPGFGLSGPYAGYRVHGTQLEGMIGHTHARGYPVGQPDEAGDAYTADAAGGVQGALAVLMALRHRRLTGEGQEIELAQADNFLPFLAELILDVTMKGQDLGPWGNRHRSHAPHGVFPCTGEDQWIALDVATDAEFAALCGVLGLPALVHDARFATPAARHAHQDALNPLLSEATRTRDKWDLFRALQAAGVAAGPLQNCAERIACPQLAARGFFQELDSPSAGRFPYPGAAWKLARTPNRFRRGPVLLGQDNDAIYRDLLGIPEEAYARLQETGAVSTTYHARVFGMAAAH